LAKLTIRERNALPDDTFGLPEKREYPMPDVSHAKNSKSRAAEEFNRGVLSLAEKRQIDAKADQIIGTT
jgi:hypothetical protein